MRYQSHSPGEKGMVDSQRRLERLQIPADLRGKSVLDIGCNEGFFCNVAATRGARRVVGLEISESALRTARELYGSSRVDERHRHRYEVNNAYRDILSSAGLFFSGLSPDRNLVEYVELPRDVHPYYIATQAHPELRSRPTDPHPLFRGLVGAALERHRASELFDVDNG